MRQAMSKTPKKIRIREIRWLFWRTMCRIIPLIRSLIHFYDEGRYAHQVLDTPFWHHKTSRTLQECNISLTEDDKAFIKECWNKEYEIIPEVIDRHESLYVVEGVRIYGHTGVTVKDRYVLIDANASQTSVNRNFCKARFMMTAKQGDPKTLYHNMVGVSVGHKHFYHFFIDLFFHVFCLLKAFPDINTLHKAGFDTVTILIRDDLSSFQRQAYDYITQHYPYVKLEILHLNEYYHHANISYTDLWQNIYTSYLPQDYISFIKRIFTPDPDFNANGRYYISRDDTKNRQISNEEEVVAYLHEHGFERIYPASLPLSQQIAVFAHSKEIISMAGAAFTNLIHAHPQTSIIIFYPKGLVGSQYLWLAKAVGLKNVKHVILNDMAAYRQHTPIPLSILKQSL